MSFAAKCAWRVVPSRNGTKLARRTGNASKGAIVIRDTCGTGLNASSAKIAVASMATPVTPFQKLFLPKIATKSALARGSASANAKM